MFPFPSVPKIPVLWRLHLVFCQRCAPCFVQEVAERAAPTRALEAGAGGWGCCGRGRLCLISAPARRAGLLALALGWVSGPHRGLASSASCPCALGKSLFTPKVAGRAWGGPGLHLLGLPCSSSVGLSPGAAPLPSQLPLPSSLLLPPFSTRSACLRLPQSLTLIPVWLSFQSVPFLLPPPCVSAALVLSSSAGVPLCPSLSTSAAPLRHTGDVGTVQAHLL